MKPGLQPTRAAGSDAASAVDYPARSRVEGLSVSKKTKKRKLRARRSKPNHGKRPNVGRR